MNTKDQDNFLKLSVKGFKQMAKDFGKFDKSLEKLAKDAVKFGSKGYLQFMNWFQKLNQGDKLALAGEIAYYTKQKDKTIEKMLRFRFEDVEKTFKQVTEARSAATKSVESSSLHVASKNFCVAGFDQSNASYQTTCGLSAFASAAASISA